MERRERRGRWGFRHRPRGPLSAGRAGASGRSGGTSPGGFAAERLASRSRAQRSRTRSLAGESGSSPEPEPEARRGPACRRGRPAAPESRVSCVPPTLRPALRSHGDRHHALRAPGQSASWQAGKSGNAHSRPCPERLGACRTFGSLQPCLSSCVMLVFQLGGSENLDPKFIFSQDGISMEARLASSFPGSGDGGTSASQQTGGHGAHCLWFRPEGVRAGVPGPECLPVPDAHRSPPGPSRHFMRPGLRAELPAWGRGSGKHSSVGSTAWEPDPQLRGRGVLYTLQSPEGRQVGVPDLRATLRQSAGGALVT